VGTFHALLIANRGEIAIRIGRAAAALGLRSVMVYAEDDADSLHRWSGDEARALPGQGARAYLDADALVTAALDSGCDAVHPGYGFLAEKAGFARRCADAGLTFVGPGVEHLKLFGDKARARAEAAQAGVPVPRGLDHPVTVEEARAFFTSLGPGAAVMIKAIAGGGGRGTRLAESHDELAASYARCQSEARTAFGSADVYVEEYLPGARHIEVQVAGDVAGHVIHLGERDCTLQRRHQKLIEIAPAPWLADATRLAMTEAAVRLAARVGYTSLGTFEFLVSPSRPTGDAQFAFIEANARLQVEHTVTEEVTGVDLVEAQIRLAGGASLADLGLDDTGAGTARGYAVQARVNMETPAADGSVHPEGGTLKVYEPPGGPGIRTDGFGYVGYTTSQAYDSLLAKVIAYSRAPDITQALSRLDRALREFRIDGVATNIAFLRAILEHPDVAAGRIHTRFVDQQLGQLANGAAAHAALAGGRSAPVTVPAGRSPGARLRSRDPLALFDYDARLKSEQAAAQSAPPPQGADAAGGLVGLASPMPGTVVSIDVEVGDEVRAGQTVGVIEAMKMEHLIRADRDGVVRRIPLEPGDIVSQGDVVVLVEESEAGEWAGDASEAEIDLGHIRDDLAELNARRAYVFDENRPEAVAKRHDRGYRMPRENIADLVDPGSFLEYWPLVVARQHQRHDMETLRRTTPADGLVGGTATINSDLFPADRCRTLVVSYDYTVLAGTQGSRNHYKQDRMYELASRFGLPVVLFAEGGGGRPGDDRTGPGVAFDTHTFTQFSRLSGLVPLVGIGNGRCFAGNTALLACCDVIIATEGSTIAMGGPAMIEGGGLGVYTPEEVGPMSFQVPNGVVDLLVPDEAAAVEAARKYLSYFQGAVTDWEAPDQRYLRHIVPENRLRLYDMREIIATIADRGSVLELRERFGVGVITAFARVEGRPVGVIANNPGHLAGAIDSDGADKGARFLQLCDAFDIPVLSLMDCPGIMVGPEAERTALVRHSVRMFNVGANLTVPLFGVVVRKAYGLGVLAMCGASSSVGLFTVGWPTAEFAGMNLEGAVKLGYRRQLAAIEDPEQRAAEFERRVAEAYEGAKAVNAAAGGGLDDVIDPADTRDWIATSLRGLPAPQPRTGKKYPYIDTW